MVTLFPAAGIVNDAVKKVYAFFPGNPAGEVGILR
jgi:hypothetical protein